MSDALRARVEELEAATGGTVGIAATVLAGGRHIGYRETELFPLASLVKAPILVTLFQDVAAGEADLSERVEYRRELRVPGSGVLQDLDDGLRLTLRDLAMLMITVSDNTAADVLLERVTKARVESTMDALGLDSVRVPFSILELFAELTNTSLEAGYYGAEGEGAGRSGPAQQGTTTYDELRKRLRLSAGDGGRAIIPEQGVRGTPAHLCRLFELVESRAILTEEACGQMLDILKRQHVNSRIPALLPQGTIVAHKTGTIRGVRNDAGIVYAPHGPYAVAILSRGVKNGPRTDLALAEISQRLYEELTV